MNGRFKALFSIFFYAVFLFAAIICSGVFTGCTSEIKVELKKDGAVNVSFNGTAGQAFTALINSAAGTEGSNVLFDTKEIQSEMTASGFENVKAVSKNGRDLSLTMTDSKRKSAMFTSGAISVKDSKLSGVLDAKSLLDFYKSADSQTTMFLDMLLAPVFNDEKMSEEEYLETIAAFYGQEIADEISAANFRITLKNADGSEAVRNIKLTKLLTLDETIRF